MQNEQLKEAMNTMEKGEISMRMVIKHLNIPFSSSLDNLNGKTKCKKVSPPSVVLKEDVIVV
jgi:hypothetical protein